MAVKKVLYYALGGGLGHLTRSYAILQALKAITDSPLEISLITNSPHAKFINQSINSAVDRLLIADSPAMLSTLLAQLFSEDWHLLIVDTFPRGLMGELSAWLAKLKMSKVLIQRYLNEQYLERFDVANFTQNHYQLALRLTDTMPAQLLTAHMIDLPPVTILPFIDQQGPKLFSDNGDGERKVDDKRAINGRKLLFIDFGKEADAFLEVLYQTQNINWTVVTTRPAKRASVDHICYYPAATLFPQTDLVVGNGGYNLFHELKLTNKPAIFLPQPRTYDDQFSRVKSYPAATNTEQFSLLLNKFSTLAPLNRSVIEHNSHIAQRSVLTGAYQAAEKIKEILM